MINVDTVISNGTNIESAVNATTISMFSGFYQAFNPVNNNVFLTFKADSGDLSERPKFEVKLRLRTYLLDDVYEEMIA